jgi:hypothetical protein
MEIVAAHTPPGISSSFPLSLSFPALLFGVRLRAVINFLLSFRFWIHSSFHISAANPHLRHENIPRASVGDDVAIRHLDAMKKRVTRF